MRILFLPFSAAKSHVFHMTPVAWALRTAGHQVRMASDPDLAEDIARSGLTGVTLGEPMYDTMTQVDDDSEPTAEEKQQPPAGYFPIQTDYAKDDPHGELEYLTQSFLQHVIPDAMLDELVSFCRDWEPDLVIWDQMCPIGAVAARASGAAHARFLWGTDALTQLRAAALGRGQGDPLRAWLEPTLARYGCAFDEEVVTGQWTIDTTPSWMWHPKDVHYVRTRHVAFNGPNTVPNWLYEKPTRPRVCMTLGVTMQDSKVAAADNLFDAVADLDVEVIATIGAEQQGSLPDNVRAVDFAPMNVLLPTCSAIIHHGGAGTFAAALEHGVPQLIVPSSYWTVMWYGPVAMANGLAQNGAGAYVAVNSDHLTAQALRENLVRVLDDPSFGRNAARLRAEMLGTPTPNDLVPALEKLVSLHRGLRT